jgi:hypothetical protein
MPQSLLCFQLFLQQSQDVRGSAKLLITLFSNVFHVFHAQANAAIDASPFFACLYRARMRLS